MTPSTVLHRADVERIEDHVEAIMAQSLPLAPEHLDVDVFDSICREAARRGLTFSAVHAARRVASRASIAEIEESRADRKLADSIREARR